MIQEFMKIKYSYYYVDDNGNFEDALYTCKNFFINYNNAETIINAFFMESDNSKVLRNIISIENLGKRFFS